MNPYSIQKLQEHFFVIEEGSVRCFLFTGGKRALLIDTGLGTGDLRQAVTTVTDLPVSVVQTHADGDHLGCTASFDAVHLHPSEFDRFATQMKATALPSLQPLWEGDFIKAGPYHFKVLLIPGHTPGSIALLETKHRFLIGGDSIQTGPIYMFGPGRNLAAYRASMSRIWPMRDAFDTIYASHGHLKVHYDLLPDLIEGASRIESGLIEGLPPPQGLPCRLYRYGQAQFYGPIPAAKKE